MDTAAKRFFCSRNFAVVGASQDKSKFGYRIFAWYHNHGLSVIPVNPSRPTISVSSRSYDTVPTVSKLQSPADTAVSFLTPPPVTRKVLQEAKAAGIKSVWLQPGSFDDAGMKFAQENFENAIGGFEDGTVGGEGWCVLVDGERAMNGARPEGRSDKL